MRQIRNGCFETNSSSAHSLVIKKKDEYFTHDEMLESLYEVEDGVYNSGDEDWYFGRAPFTMLSSFEQKLQYAFANMYEEEDIWKLSDLLKELVPEVERIELPDTMGVDDYELRGWLERENITMREFLTNKKYIVVQDGDEYYIWDKFLRSGLINKEAMQ